MRWVYAFQRELPLHFLYLVNEGYTREMLKQVGWGFRNVMFISRNGIEKSYRGEEDEAGLDEFIRKRLHENPGFASEIKEKIRKFSHEYETVLESIKKTDLKEKSSRELSALYNKACEAEVMLDSVFQFPIYFEKIAGCNKKIMADIEAAAGLREAFSRSFYDIYRDDYAGLFTEIVRRFSIDPGLIECMSPPEVSEIIQKGKLRVPEKVLKQRCRFSVLITKGGKVRLRSGKEAKEIVKEELEEKETPETGEMSGTPACAAKVHGRQD